MLLNVVYYTVYRGKAKPYDCVGTAVIDSYFSCVLITKGCTGEGNIGHISNALVYLTGVDKILCTAVFYLPGLLSVKNAGGEAVYKTVAGFKHTVIKTQPALACFNGYRTCAYQP